VIAHWESTLRNPARAPLQDHFHSPTVGSLFKARAWSASARPERNGLRSLTFTPCRSLIRPAAKRLPNDSCHGSAPRLLFPLKRAPTAMSGALSMIGANIKRQVQRAVAAVSVEDNDHIRTCAKSVVTTEYLASRIRCTSNVYSQSSGRDKQRSVPPCRLLRIVFASEGRRPKSRPRRTKEKNVENCNVQFQA
jgi:hypothetical protein